jgi:hypothetical protein
MLCHFSVKVGKGDDNRDGQLLPEIMRRRFWMSQPFLVFIKSLRIDGIRQSGT